MSPSIRLFKEADDVALMIHAVVAGEAVPYVHRRVPAVFQDETMCAPIAGRVATGNFAARVNPNKAPPGTGCDRIRRIECRERAVDQHEAVKSISGVDVVPSDVTEGVDGHCLDRDRARVVDRGESSVDECKSVKDTVGTLVPADDVSGGIDSSCDRERCVREIYWSHGPATQDVAVCSAIGRIEASNNGQLSTAPPIIPVVVARTDMATGAEVFVIILF